MVIRGQITEKKLEQIYDIVRSCIKNKECYYTQEEVEKKVKEIFTIRFNGVKQDLDKILETEDNGRTSRIYYRCKGVKRD